MAKEEENISGETCPMCGQKTLILHEEETEVPFFGKMYLFSMTCTNCKYHKSDIEAAERKESCKFTLEVSSPEDLKIRIVKSSEATVKVPYISEITPGPASQGYVTNVEGVLRRIKTQIEHLKESAEDNNEKKAAWKMIKKINKIFYGSEKCRIILTDPSGNSAIISDKAVKSKL